MNAIKTRGIVLARVDYGEADRVVTVLTDTHGKLSLMAKGARRLKSKLAGGIELFSVNDISFIKGRGEVGTLISSRMADNYHNIIQDINRVRAGYQMLKTINKNTEPDVDREYFDLMASGLKGLNDMRIDLDLVKCWFRAHYLVLAGHYPNLMSNAKGEALSGNKFLFDFENMSFNANNQGNFTQNDIKFLRLLFSKSIDFIVQKVDMRELDLSKANNLVSTIYRDYTN